MDTCGKENGGVGGTGNKQTTGTQEGHRVQTGGSWAYLPILGPAPCALSPHPQSPGVQPGPAVATHCVPWGFLLLQRGEGCSYATCTVRYGLQNTLLFISPLYSHNIINETPGLSDYLKPDSSISAV